MSAVFHFSFMLMIVNHITRYERMKDNFVNFVDMFFLQVVCTKHS